MTISGGASDFRLIAVWAMPVKGSTVKSYIGQVYEAIANHPQWFPSNAVVGAGPNLSRERLLCAIPRGWRDESPIGGSSLPESRSSNFHFPKRPSSPSSTLAASKPVILCGDFNSNKIWDDHRKTHNHSAVVSLLEQRGLLSAYHHFFSEPQGHETRPTYYFWHRQSRGYHIDYVFLPRAWPSCIQSVTVGHHANWSHLSDHAPLSIDVTVTVPDS